MNRTAAHVVAALQRLGYLVSERQLQDWSDQGLLPPRQSRGRGRGKGKVFYWTDRSVIRQAVTIFELLDWHGHVQHIRLSLWILGYDQPLDLIRHELLARADRSTHTLTAGNKDIDDLGDHLATVARRWTLLSKRRGGHAYNEATNIHLLNTLANPWYDPNEEEFTEEHIESFASNLSLSDLPGLLSALQWMSLPRVRDAIVTATEVELRQAQFSLAQLLNASYATVRFAPELHEACPRIGFNFIDHVAVQAIGILIALRRKHAQQLDEGLALVNGFAHRMQSAKSLDELKSTHWLVSADED